MSTERDLYTRMSRATYQYAKDRAANAAEWTMLERAFRSGATDKFFSALTPTEHDAYDAGVMYRNNQG